MKTSIALCAVCLVLLVATQGSEGCVATRVDVSPNFVKPAKSIDASAFDLVGRDGNSEGLVHVGARHS